MGVDMTMRVRRLGVLGLVFVAGASLLRSSMALTGPAAAANPTFTLSLSETRGPDTTNIWAMELPASEEAGWIARSGTHVRLPDGISALILTVQIARQPRVLVLTNAVSAASLLEAMGVKLRELDRVNPSRGAILWNGFFLRVIRIRQVVQTFNETEPFKTLIQYSSELPPGQSQILREGVPGQAVRTYRVTLRNGQEVGRELVSEDILTPRVDQIVLVGADGILHGSQLGQASWYDFCRVEGDYAAHLSLPFGTVVTVTNLDNGKSVTVVINDRGPYGVPGRIIDLCDSAFAKIAPLSQGVADVEISW